MLTRLHARYGKDVMANDLVFKEATGIAGGREFLNKDGIAEKGAQPSGMNNFQGRYAIRHAWTGPIACENPRRGVWGGPPAGVSGSSHPKPALDLAFAPRGKAPLASFVKRDIPELGVTAAGAAEPQAGTDSAATKPQSQKPEKKSEKSKGCSAGPTTGGYFFGLLLALAALGLTRRRTGSAGQL